MILFVCFLRFRPHEYVPWCVDTGENGPVLESRRRMLECEAERRPSRRRRTSHRIHHIIWICHRFRAWPFCWTCCVEKWLWRRRRLRFYS
jgi:hypothetical protein